MDRGVDGGGERDLGTHCLRSRGWVGPFTVLRFLSARFLWVFGIEGGCIAHFACPPFLFPASILSPSMGDVFSCSFYFIFNLFSVSFIFSPLTHGQFRPQFDTNTVLLSPIRFAHAMLV
ncbi:hypothetical protein LZ31DRAFT_96892 [Colletotrichum somersetense]|nr:hypothetical protein LZ31DRAFT_96892 [Colletotrichum somersetense]